MWALLSTAGLYQCSVTTQPLHELTPYHKGVVGINYIVVV